MASHLINSDKLDIKSLHRSFILIEGRMKNILKENDELKKEIKCLVDDKKKLLTKYHQKLIENNILHKKVQILINDKSKFIFNSIMSEPTKINDKYINIGSRKNDKTQNAERNVEKSDVSYNHKRKRRDPVDSHIGNNSNIQSKSMIPISQYRSKYDKVWVCYYCMPPKLLSKNEFLNHANFYLHLDSCIAYSSVNEANTAIIEYQNCNDRFASNEDVSDTNTSAYHGKITNDSTKRVITCFNDDASIKKETIDLEYCWNTSLDNEIISGSVENQKPSIEKKPHKEKKPFQTISETKSKLKVIKCTTCFEEFPTRERKLLHTCNSISDKYYVSKE